MNVEQLRKNDRRKFVFDTMRTITQTPLAYVQKEASIQFCLPDYGVFAFSNGLVDQYREDLRHGLNDFGFFLAGMIAERRRVRENIEMGEVWL